MTLTVMRIPSPASDPTNPRTAILQRAVVSSDGRRSCNILHQRQMPVPPTARSGAAGPDQAVSIDVLVHRADTSLATGIYILLPAGLTDPAHVHVVFTAGDWCFRGVAI